MFFCGWNGFGQVEGNPSIISTPLELTYDGHVMSVSCSWSLLAVVTDRSFTISGFLGNQPSVKRQIQLTDGSKALNVSSCLSQTLIASTDGKCFIFESDKNAIRQLRNVMLAESTEKDGTPEKDDAVVKVSCSDYCKLALSKSGKVFTIPSVLSTPGLVVSDVCCGNEHCVLRTQCGSIYTWGGGSRGQLGHGDLESEENPRLVEALAGLNVQSISAGAWHCSVVTSSGDLYTWGWGSNGQLGLKDAEDGKEECLGTITKITDEKSRKMDVKYRGFVQAFPVPVDTPSNVISVSCGSRHTVILLDDGGVWGCGWNAYGQLGHPPEKCNQSENFVQISIPGLRDNVSKIQCGGWSSCFII